MGPVLLQEGPNHVCRVELGSILPRQSPRQKALAARPVVPVPIEGVEHIWQRSMTVGIRSSRGSPLVWEWMKLGKLEAAAFRDGPFGDVVGHFLGRGCEILVLEVFAGHG